jgi:AraC-like DNA-binding protein
MAHEPIEILRFTTADLPQEERYEAWLARSWPRMDLIFRTEPFEPFNTLFESVELGDIAFVHAEITGMRWKRRLQDIRSSDFDPLIVNMMVRGSAHGDFDGRPFHEETGAFSFHDLARPSVHVSTASRTYSIVIPRPLASILFGSLEDLHGLVVTGACADMLLTHADRAWHVLPDLDRSCAPMLARSLLELLLVAVTHARSSAPRVGTLEVRLRRRARELLESQLNKPVSVQELCKALNVSRSKLFAAFRTDGGVQNYIRNLRLERAKAALADLERGEPIGTIALRLGFCDAPHLTRLFRARYGMTPRDYRHLISADDRPDFPDPVFIHDGRLAGGRTGAEPLHGAVNWPVAGPGGRSTWQKTHRARSSR